MKNLKLINDLTKAYRKSVIELVSSLETGVKQISKSLSKKSIHPENPAIEKYSGQRMFIESLKAIGRPAMTKEIMDRFKKLHPELKLQKNKLIMHRFYNSASILAKEGVIKRTPVGKKSYEYSLAS